MRTEINKKSDFDFIVLDNEGNAVDMPSNDFTLDLWTWGSKCRFRASSIGGVLKGCKSDNGKLRVYVDNPGFVPGKLVGEWVSYISSEEYPDGTQRTCRYISDFGIDMVDGDSQTNEVQVLAMMQYIQGESAYEIACEYGFDGTEQEWLDSLALPANEAAAECRTLMTELSNAEAQRVANEDVRTANEETRVQQESARVTAEQQRVQAESDRALAETNRDLNEQYRSTTEQKRIDNEAARVEAEKNRVANESSRVSDESLRVQAETERVEAEAQRETAEQQRVKAENDRAMAEVERAGAEQRRKYSESGRQDNEAKRKDAEEYRIKNENGREATESSRVKAENERVSAENARKTAEDDRIANEATRQTNEQARVSAETSRESAETDRADAEAARVEAEAARVEEFATFTATLAAKEDVANKVTSINADADDVHYPSAKAVWSAIEDKFWYGIEKDTTVSTPTCTRIGNMDLHRTMPVHSLMRGCLLADDGTVNKYLDPDDWTNEVRDGSQGQVMVEIPRHYRKCETDGNIIRVKLSLLPLDGFVEIPKMYVSAYEAALERSTKKLCSVVNEGTDFRGGNGTSAWDGTYRSLLGKPVTNINRTNFRNYARNRNTATAEWNCYTYDVHTTLWWLFVTEYATLNSQADYNEELTAEGYHQGGLGAGVTTVTNNQLTEYNNYNPLVKCGYTDYAGNKTTQAMCHLENDDASISLDVAIPRYRGIEHLFGHLWKITDGITVIISPTVANGGDGTSKAYVASDPKLFNDTDVNGYRSAGLEPRGNAYVKSIKFGEYGDIVPTAVGASSSTYYCDYYKSIISKTESTMMWVIGADATGYSMSGFMDISSDSAPSRSLANFGTRLCFIPQK